MRKTKILTKESKEMERYTLYSWVRILNIVKLSVLPSLSYRFNEIPVQIPVSYFVDIDKQILKFAYTILKT